MFQRRSDLQIMRVLTGVSRRHAEEMGDANKLLKLADSTNCPYPQQLDTLKAACDLTKDPVTKRGKCSARPTVSCHLKQHTELLKRYGHFGKMPTSIALALRAQGASSLTDLKTKIWVGVKCPKERVLALERAVSQAWRVNEKIAAMFLSAVTNRDLSGELAPWTEGVDSSHFVVIDSNVDLFLKAIGYPGSTSYRARREFLQTLSERIHLEEFNADIDSYNPRLVQQALYMFNSVSNRRANSTDCSHAATTACPVCPKILVRICPRYRAKRPRGNGG
jgi:hypothetical protein